MSITNITTTINQLNRPLNGYIIGAASDNGFGDGYGEVYTNQTVVDVTLRATGTVSAYALSDDISFTGATWIEWPNRTPYVVVVVMDGVRLTESLGTPANIPNIMSIAGQGSLFSNFWVDTPATTTIPGHDAIVTGYYEGIANDGSENPLYPTFFQQYLYSINEKSNDIDGYSQKAKFITSKDKLACLTQCTTAGAWNLYRPWWNCGVNGDGTGGYRSDALTHALFKTECLGVTPPRISMVSYASPDTLAHASDWAGYINAIQTCDGYIGEIWALIQAHPLMKDNTYLIITSDHGRAADPNFNNHGGTSDSERQVLTVIAGPDVKSNFTESTRYDTVDIHQTISNVLSIDNPYGTGEELDTAFLVTPITAGSLATVSYTLAPDTSPLGSERRLFATFTSDVTLIGTTVTGALAEATDSIILKTSAPIPDGPTVDGYQTALVINNGENITNNRMVTIHSYVQNAVEMKLTEGDLALAPWIPFIDTLPYFMLSAGFGPKLVKAMYRDIAGNETLAYTASINYSETLPAYTLSLNGNSGISYSRIVKVGVLATPTPPASIESFNLSGIWISEYPNFAIRSEYTSPDLPSDVTNPFIYHFQVSSGSGLKTIYVKLFNGTGNNVVQSAVIYLDQITPSINPALTPGGKVVIVNPATGGLPTNNPQVVVTFAGVQSANSVIISNLPDFSDATWQPLPYEPGSTTMLSYLHLLNSSTQGLKTIYVRFSDAVESGVLSNSEGNVTQTYTGSIIYDSNAPIIPGWDGYGNGHGVIINNGDEYAALEPIIVNGVSKFFVQLTMNAVNATEMKVATSLVSGDFGPTVVWQPYTPSLTYEVAQQTGVLTVYVRYRDDADNETQLFYDTIQIVDTRPIVPGPLGPYTILINGGATRVNSNNVTLTLNATPDSTLEMLISESALFTNASWEPYQTTRAYSFVDTADGNKTIYVKFRVKLLNTYYRESSVSNASIIKDTAAPVITSPGIIINGGQIFTREQQVALTFNVDETAVMMQVFNEIDYNPLTYDLAPWIGFVNPTSWTLSNGNGEKRVYVRFRDAVGNPTAFVSSAIKFNGAVPSAPIIVSPANGETVNQRVIKVTGTAEPGALVTVTVRPRG